MLNIHDHQETGLTDTVRKVSIEAFKALNLNETHVFNVIIVDDAHMQEINQTFAQKDATTDVLSFPSGLDDEVGDVFISIDKATLQADELGHSLEREVGFLTVHGLLHCLGYTHETEEDLAKMTELQETILAPLNLVRSQ